MEEPIQGHSTFQDGSVVVQEKRGRSLVMHAAQEGKEHSLCGAHNLSSKQAALGKHSRVFMESLAESSDFTTQANLI